MRKFRLNIFVIVLYSGVFAFLNLFICSPVFGIAFLFNRADDLRIVFPALIISSFLTFLLSEIYFGYYPSRVILNDMSVTMYGIFRRYDFDVRDIQSIKLLKHLESKDWGAEYGITANVNGKIRTFYLKMQAIKDLSDLINLIS